MIRTSVPLALLLAALGGLSSAALAAGWSDYSASFAPFPCQDGWMGCVVEGEAISPDLRTAGGVPVPADLRISWTDLKPTPAFSPFVGLSAYTGQMQAPPEPPPEVVAVADPEPAPPPEIPSNVGSADPEPPPARDPEPARPVASNPDPEPPPNTRPPATPAEPVASSVRPPANGTADPVGSSVRPPSNGTAAVTPPATPATPPASSVRPPATPADPVGSSVRPPANGTAAATPPATPATPPAAVASSTPPASSVRPPAAGTAPAIQVPTTPPAAAAAVVVDDSCDNLAKLEPQAMLGKLSDGQVTCLEGAYGSAAKQTDKNKVSRILMANAYSKGDTKTWEKLVKRHLEEVDQSDPDLCFKYANHLAKGGPSRASGTIRWANVALENRSMWTGDTYTSRVSSLYKLRAAAAQSLWKQAEEEYSANAGDDAKKKKVDDARNQTKVFSREWYEYAKQAGKDTTTAMQLCISAAGTKDYCESGG